MSVIYREITITTEMKDGRFIHNVRARKGIEDVTISEEPLVSAQKRLNEVAYTVAENKARETGGKVGDILSRVSYLTEE